MTVLITWLSPRQWVVYDVRGSWWVGFSWQRDWWYLRVFGLEVSVT